MSSALSGITLLLLSLIGEGGRGRIRRVLTQSQENGFRRMGDFLIVVAWAAGGAGEKEGRSSMVPKNEIEKNFLERLSVVRKVQPG